MILYKKIISLIIRFIISIILFSSLSCVAVASDALLYFSPNLGEYEIGTTFDVGVQINTGTDPINAVQARVIFNPEELRVVEISKGDSVLGSWTQLPAFSNEDGELSFAGSTDESYIGVDGKIVVITFEALKNTQTEVIFADGAAILADDGLASNILTKMGSSIFTLTPKRVVQEVRENTTLITNLLSSTHPDEDLWYNVNTAHFSWATPFEVVSFRVSLNNQVDDVSFVMYEDVKTTEKTIEHIEDGAWIFNVEAYDGIAWGDVSTYKINIDTKEPHTLVIKETAREDLSSPDVSFRLSAHDTTSQIVRYETKIDEGTWGLVDFDEGLFRPKNINAGNHILYTRAYDSAENFVEELKNFSIKTIIAPVLSKVESPEEIGGPLVISGGADPYSDVKLWIELEGTDPIETLVQSDKEGVYSYVYDDNVLAGVYTVWAQAVGSEGVLSELSDRVSIRIVGANMASINDQVIEFVVIVIPLVGFVILLAYVLVTRSRKIEVYQDKIEAEVNEAQEVVHSTFSNIHAEMREYLDLLNEAEKKRELTYEEVQIKFFLSSKFHDEEEVVQTEIEDIVEIEKVIPKKKIIQVSIVE